MHDSPSEADLLAAPDGAGSTDTANAEPLIKASSVPVGCDSERTALLLRLYELDRRLKLCGGPQNGLGGDELRASREVTAELLRQHEETRSSESWRLGNRVVRAVRAPGAPIGTALAPAFRSWRSRPTSRERAYRRATAPASPFAALETSRLPAAVAGEGRLAELTHELRRARADGPRCLEPTELDAIRRALAPPNSEPDLEDCARRLLAIHEPIEPTRDVARERGALVIDVRALQLPIECGTKTHGEHIARAVCAALPATTRVLMLSSPRLPDVAPSVGARFDGHFTPGATPLEGVAAFLQLAVFSLSVERQELGLLRAPWVHRTVVWLDAIQGLYPSTFLPDDANFLEYQYGIECVGRAAHVLALSEASRAELPPNLDPATKISVTGSRPGLAAADAAAATIELPERACCVLVGSALPHKNLVAGVAAFTRSRRARRERMSLLVVAALDGAQRAALRDLTAAAGADADGIVFLGQIARADLARVIQRAEAVIVPSLHEGFSLPIVEALGLDTPVVASDIRAHRELLGDDPALAEADPLAIAQALDDVLARSGDVLARQRGALTSRYDPAGVDRAAADVVRDLVVPVPAPNGARRTTRTELGPRPVLPTSKICNLEDFTHPELAPVLREHFAHEIARFGPQFPEGREWRKHWEIGMALRTFANAGLLDGQHDFLGVGAGNEPTSFLLTRHARRVVATDLYLGEEWAENANPSMMTDPGWNWPFAWQPERLEVEHMDGRDLQFPDDAFHGIFSSSSIEHFGNRGEISRALDEMYRVLAPGGVLSVSSEYRIEGPPPGLPGVAMFDADDIDGLFVGDREWSLLEPFDDTVSPATLETAADFAAVAWDQGRQVSELGGYYTHLLEYASYPHIVLASAPYVFTSFHVALRKHA